jgi:TldD protein
MFKEDFLRSVIELALSRGGDYADVFVEETRETLIRYSDRKITSISSGIVQGAGIRVISGRNYTYLYANDVDEKALEALARSAAAARATGKAGSFADFGPRGARRLHGYRAMPGTVDLDKKVSIVRRADDAARSASGEISQVIVGYGDTHQKVTISTSEGRCVDDERVRTRLMVEAIASRGDKKESGYHAPGKSLGFEFFDTFTPESVAKEAARIALVMLDADNPPAGTMPVVIDNGFGGVIFHEACGHALEATSVADDASVFCGKLGQKIAADCVSAIDDGSIPNEWGSAAYDDDALEPRKNVLIENGILKSYLVDRLGQAKMGIPANGSGRRESYKYAPTSRMSNTYIAPGPHKRDALIASVDKGLYCANMGGGSVNPATTDFNFAVSEAYLIEGGKLTKPVKHATLIGKGSEILMNIDMVADNLEFGTGMCGSSSGSVPANVGQPAIRVHGLVVGGKE